MPRSYETHDRNIEEAKQGERCCRCWRPIGKPTGKERLCWWCEKDEREGVPMDLGNDDEGEDEHG